MTAIASKDAETVADTIYRDWFSKFGIPAQIHMDGKRNSSINFQRSTIHTTPFELLFGEKARLPSFPNEDIQQIHYGKTSAAERFNFLQNLRYKAHQSATEQGQKLIINFDKNTKPHNFKIGDKMLIANDFYMAKILNWNQISKALVKSLTLMTLTLK